ncbi:MAG: hypothetical protein ACRDTD_17330 [Pseudonocardiaceae bacterium]
MDKDDEALLNSWIREREAEKGVSPEEQLAQQVSEEVRQRQREREQEIRYLAGRPIEPSAKRRSRRQVGRPRPEFRRASMEAFEEAIKERFEGSGEVPDELIGTAAYQWFEFTPGLDVATAWWASGVNPLDVRFTDLLRAGARPEDLAVVVDGRTLLEHFRSGLDHQSLGEKVLCIRLCPNQSSA